MDPRPRTRKQAVEKVKGMHVEPGRQPEAVRDMLFEAIDYLRAHDLITVPGVASESLRMVMLSPERQMPGQYVELVFRVPDPPDP